MGIEIEIRKDKLWLRSLIGMENNMSAGHGSIAGYLGPLSVADLIDGWVSRGEEYVGQHRRPKGSLEQLRNRGLIRKSGFGFAWVMPEPVNETRKSRLTLRDIWRNFKAFVN